MGCPSDAKRLFRRGKSFPECHEFRWAAPPVSAKRLAVPLFVLYRFFSILHAK